MKVKSLLLFTLFTFLFLFTKAQCPNFSWAKQGGGSQGDDISKSISIDTVNNFVYITGKYNSPGYFGGKDYPPNGWQDAFIAKLDLDGNYIWVKNGGGSQNDEGWDVAADHRGNVYACGYVKGIAKFDTFSTQGKRCYLVKYNAKGEVQWLKNYDFELYSLAVDGNGNLLITGSYWFDTPFEGDTLRNVKQTDIMVAKFDSNGNLLWKNYFGSKEYDYAYDVACDKNNNVYIGGYFWDTMLVGKDTLIGQKSSDVYIVKYDENGNYLKSKQLGYLNTDGFENLAIDSDDNIIITGNFYGYTKLDTMSLYAVTGTYGTYVAKFDSAFNILWAHTHNGAIGGVAIGKNNEVLTSAYFYSKLYYWGSNVINSYGDYDIVTFSYSKNGTLNYVMQSGGTKEDRAYDIAAHPDGNYFITGEFAGTAYFSGLQIKAQIGLSWNYTADVFVAKVQSQEVKANAGADKIITCSQSAKLNGSSNLSGSTFLWTPTKGLDDAKIANPMASPIVTTEYRLIVTDQCGNNDTDYVKVTVNPLNVTAKAISDQTITCGNQVKLNVTTNSTDATYRWTPSKGLSETSYHSPWAEPLSTTTYTVKVTDKYGCGTASDEVKVTVNPIQANAGIDQKILCGTETTLGINYNPNVTSYQWTPANSLNNVNIHNPKANPVWPTTYVLTLKDKCGNTTNDDVFVDVNRTSHFSYTINGMVVNFQKHSSECSSFLWEFGNGVTSQTNPNPVITYATAGTYSVCLACVGQPSTCNTCVNITVPGNGSGNTVGTEDKFIQKPLHIYPNPMLGDQLYIETGDLMETNYSVAIFDCFGKKVYVKNVLSDQGILVLQNLEHLSAGLYLVQLEYQNQTRHMRLLVE